MPIAQGADDGGCVEEEEGEGRHGRPTQTPSNGKGVAASDVRTNRLQGDMAGIVTSTNCMSKNHLCHLGTKGVESADLIRQF